MKNTERQIRIHKLKIYLERLYERHGSVPLDVEEAIQERIRSYKNS